MEREDAKRQMDPEKTEWAFRVLGDTFQKFLENSRRQVLGQKELPVDLTEAQEVVKFVLQRDNVTEEEVRLCVLKFGKDLLQAEHE